ncbi:2,4'-dihydroxyacetophenone dioxygenase family protein [Nocardia sp. NEAU-G5]|uniref:2,4'-dihydroxyacetophenone dioxygenase family protein n=1 Tax=Nocardia albiluteola TaxID=2842303 RepID=A0ABS6AZU4_9NOCA|nr:2,4'-dihydroxyacetophenone dioxygenase family protein [Nocardia albiluteola]MBU3062726.1 2,4'-dihydroxyacetophenone dioxygenase family protein [Nocardia albiluteola]
MTLTAAPKPATTSTGTPLPLVALPQGELLTVNSNDIPLIRDALGPGVHFKPLRLDLETGQWVVLAIFEPGAAVPLHYHTGIAQGYTLAGRWHYLEYPDQMQTAGSYLYEPAGSVHTFVSPADNTEDTVLLAFVEGGNVNFTEDGHFHSILDGVTIRHLTDALSQAQGLNGVQYIGGGAAGVVSVDA